MTTAHQFLMCDKLLDVTKSSDMFLDFFEVLWYNILVNKISRRVMAEVSMAVICGKFVLDHSFDHLQSWTMWKQCL